MMVDFLTSQSKDFFQESMFLAQDAAPVEQARAGLCHQRAAGGDEAPQVSVYTQRLPPELRGWVTPHITPEVNEPHDYQSWPPNVHHYKREVAAFISRYLKGAPLYGPSGADGRACLAVLLAGYKSAQTGAFEPA